VITLCGAGTLGANLAEHLARAGLGPLRIIDCDRVEEGNLSNQPYERADVGRPKVKALSERLYRAVGARLEGVSARLTAANADRLLAGSRAVADCLDNQAGRLAVQEACRRLGLPCLHAGLSPQGYGEVIWDEHYQVPCDDAPPPCGQRQSRGLALLVVALAGECLKGFLEGGPRRSFSVTLADLCVTPFPPP
jgi:molybdopterin/thiamine biosynthesis adenylyltransferase